MGNVYVHGGQVEEDGRTCGWVEWSLEAEPVEEEKNDPINIGISELNEKKMK